MDWGLHWFAAPMDNGRWFLHVSTSARHRPRYHRPHRHHIFEIELKPWRTIMAAPVTVSVGHQVNCSIIWKDANGNPMLITPTPDAPPAWTNTTPAVDTLTVAAGGLTAVDAALAPGADTVSLALAVGGVAYAAALPVTVSAAPQVLTSIDIAATVQ